MTMLESALEKIAETILGLDESSLTMLLEKYRKRMERFEPTRTWEKAIIVFFIINAVRAKNHIFNEQILRQPEPAEPEQKPNKKPHLKRVK